MSTRSGLRWWWVRHAPAAGDPRVLQRPDAPANLSDIASLRALAERLPTDALWLTSGLRRAIETYEALRKENRAVPAARIETDFAEQSFGAWTGQTWDAIPEDLQDAFWAGPITAAPPGGESFADVFARVSRRVHALTQELGEGDIVAIGHAGSIRAALAMTLGDDLARALRVDVPHLSLTRIDTAVCRNHRRVIASQCQVKGSR